LRAAGPAPAPPDRFRIDQFVVDPRRNRVVGPDGEIALQPKVIDLLCLLAERPGEVVSRSELIDRIWGVEHGGDESLTRAVSHLRKALQDGRAEPRIVETIAKRGYRLIVPVLPVEEVETPIGRGPRSRRLLIVYLGVGALLAAIAGSLLVWLGRSDDAVLPAERTGIVLFVEPFAAAAGAPPSADLDDELTTLLARDPLIRARLASAGADRGAAMRYILRGHVARTGADVRVSVQLVDGPTGDVVWGETYDRPHDPSFSQRDALVRAIATEVQLPLLRAVKRRLGERLPTGMVPWELTLMVTWVPGDEFRPAGPPDENSYWLQNRALEIDPDYAPAHALFAQLASYHAFFHPPADSASHRERARRHAERAIELAPFDAEVLYQVATYYRNAGDRDRARALLERVIQLHPTHPLAAIDLLLVEGQCDAGAGAAIARLQALDRRLSSSNPARWVLLGHLSALHLAEGDFARARETARQARAIVPVTWTALPLAAAAVELGLGDEAGAVLAEHAREWPALDLDYFAEQLVPRWCLNGSRTAAVQASFRRLARERTQVPAQ
jgi:DNA-binding winged helix-turn-helix (wHTH) protein